MCARQDHHFRNWLTALGLAEALDEPAYRKAPLGIPTLEDIAAIEVRIREKMRLKTQAEWMRIFVEEYDIGGDPFLTPEEFLEHPQLVLNNRVVEIDDPTVGKTRQIGPLALFSDTPSQIGGPPRASASTPPSSAPGQHRQRHGRAVGDHLQWIGGGWANGAASPPVTSSNGSSAARRHPLSGITVLEVAYFLAGPFGATILAELGARVIKVEPLEGDPYRRTGLGFVKMVHGKESIALDLKAEAGVEILHQLARRAAACCTAARRPRTPEDGFRHAQRDQPPPGLPLRRLVRLERARSPQGGLPLYAPRARRSGFLQAGEGDPQTTPTPIPGTGLGRGTALLPRPAGPPSGPGAGRAWRRPCSAPPGTSTRVTWSFIQSARRVGCPTKASTARKRSTGSDPCQEGWIFLAARREAEWRRLARTLDRPGWLDDPRFATRADRLGHDDELVEELRGHVPDPPGRRLDA